MPTYPAARTLETATWNAAILKGDIAAAVRNLKQDDGGGLLIASSACGPVRGGPPRRDLPRRRGRRVEKL